MLTDNDLIANLHQDVSVADKLLIILAYIDAPSSVSKIKDVANQAGFSFRRVSNASVYLSRTKGKAIKTDEGWMLTELGKEYLESKGITLDASPVIDMASDLRALLTDVSDSNTVRFLEEAIGCCEAKLYRSAVVMSWLAAIHVMQSLIHKHHLSAFNAEMKSSHANWKDVKVLGDFSRIKESEFLLRLGKISVLDGSQKKLLEECLDRRNQCGHPNSFKIHENTVRHHIEVLILNIFQPFSK